MNRKPCHLIQSPAVWSTLVSSARAEIMEALRLQGPCSMAEIAATIHRPVDTLYQHLERLQKAGLVVPAGFRKGSRNVEQLFDAVADDFMIDFHDGTGAAENKAIVGTANSFLKAMARAVRDSAAARQLEFHREVRNISINYELSWLTREAFQEMRGLAGRIKQLMDEGKEKREGRLYMSLFIATPVTRKRGANQRGRAARIPSSRIHAPSKKSAGRKPAEQPTKADANE